LAVKSSDDALDYAPTMSRLGLRLARRCWPGPVTLVTADAHPDSLIRQLPAAVQQAVVPQGTIGLRVPAHEVILEVLRLLVGPVVLTSANRRGAPEALTAAEVVAAFGDDVHLVIDDGRSRLGQPSSVVQVGEHDFTLLRAGVVPEHTLKRLASYVLLFVCTGNTCRSPMAEAIARRLLAQRLGCRVEELEDRGITVLSAGIAAMMGGRASPDAVSVLREEGVDLTAHESQPLTEQLVRHADQIFAMTRSHRQVIVSQWPEAASRTQLLCRDDSDVADPIGGPVEMYRRCALQIHQELKARLEELEV
jgi:protein-tyrosine phosphatase